MDDDDKIIPRGPFKGKRIEMASSDGVAMYQTLAEDFMRKILGYEPGDYMITDESSLHDFEPFDDSEVRKLQENVLAEYGVDVSDLESGNLLEIFRRIRRQQSGGTA